MHLKFSPDLDLNLKNLSHKNSSVYLLSESESNMDDTFHDYHHIRSKDWVITVDNAAAFDVDVILQMRYFKFVMYQTQFIVHPHYFVRAYIQTTHAVRKSVLARRLCSLNSDLKFCPYINPWDAKNMCNIHHPDFSNVVQFGLFENSVFESQCKIDSENE